MFALAVSAWEVPCDKSNHTVEEGNGLVAQNSWTREFPVADLFVTDPTPERTSGRHVVSA